MFRILAIVSVALAVATASCKKDSNNGNALIGKWYSSETYKSIGYHYYEFKPDGTMNYAYGMASATYTKTATTITMKPEYGIESTADYTISSNGKELTITKHPNQSSSGWTDGTYIK